MPRYKLVVQEVYDVWYEVEGEDEEQAYEMYFDGEGEMLDQQYSHMVEDSVEIVENLDETDEDLKKKIEKQQNIYWSETLKRFKTVTDEEDIL